MRRQDSRAKRGSPVDALRWKMSDTAPAKRRRSMASSLVVRRHIAAASNAAAAAAAPQDNLVGLLENSGLHSSLEKECHPSEGAVP